jgi:hypothetical protein
VLELDPAALAGGIAFDELELDRRAWNPPSALKQLQSSQPPFSVQFGREDKPEAEPRAA